MMMWSFNVLLLFLGASILPLAQSRPREKGHRGLYDDRKIVPYVDDSFEQTDDARKPPIQNRANLGNVVDSESYDDSDSDEKSYKNAYKQTEKSDSSDTSSAPVTKQVADPVIDIVPIEGGTEDMNGVGFEDSESELAGQTTPQTGHRRHRKRDRQSSRRRHDRKESRSRKKGQVIDDGGLSLETGVDRSSIDNTKLAKLSAVDIHTEDLELPNFDINKFYKDNPSFTSNTGIIYDESKEREKETESGSSQESPVFSSNGESDASSLEEDETSSSKNTKTSESESVEGSDSYSKDYDESYDDDSDLEEFYDDMSSSSEDTFDWNKYERMYGDAGANYYQNDDDKPYSLSNSGYDNEKKDKPFSLSNSGYDNEKKDNAYTSFKGDTKDTFYNNNKMQTEISGYDDEDKGKPMAVMSGYDNEKKDKPLTSAYAYDNEEKDKPLTSASAYDNEEKDKPLTSASAYDNEEKDKPLTSASAYDNEEKDKPLTSASAYDNEEKDKPLTSASAYDNEEKDKPLTSAYSYDNEEKDKPLTSASAYDNEEKDKPLTSISSYDNEDKKDMPLTAMSNYDNEEKGKPLTSASSNDNEDKDKPLTAISSYDNEDKKESKHKRRFVSGKEDKRYPNAVPKTDPEPRTSPNPPTKRKDWKSTVTQPVYPDTNQKTEVHEYIESKPIEACKMDSECPPGRMCKFGLCICGLDDFCDGHKKEVCGSDKVLYPSHCELHRTACKKGVHIWIDFSDACKKSDDLEDVKAKVQLIKTQDRDTNRPEYYTKVVQEKEKTQENEVHTEAAESKKDDEVPVVDAVSKTVDAAVVGGLEAPVEVQEYDKEIKVEKKYDDEEKDEQSSEEVRKVDAVKDDKKLAGLKEDEEKMQGDAPAEDTVVLGGGTVVQLEGKEQEAPEKETKLLPLYCDPQEYLKFKAKVMLYYCVYFEEKNCGEPLPVEEKRRRVDDMFEHFDHDHNGYVEQWELWLMQLRERMDKISSLCTLLDLVDLEELGVKDGKMSPDEFLKAFDIPDVLEHRHEMATLTAAVTNALEIRCSIADTEDVIWKRNKMDLALLDYPGISVLKDGSLYFDNVDLNHVGNYTCFERSKPAIKQTHLLLVHKPPSAHVSPARSDYHDGVDVKLQCFTEGLPRPTVGWRVNGSPIEPSHKYHVQTYDQTLTIYRADPAKDSGKYTCFAENRAGKAEASAEVTVHPYNDSTGIDAADEFDSVIIFHADGYTMHEPKYCLTQRHTLPTFGNFHFLPDEMDRPPSMCEPSVPCVWGSAVNVRNLFVYVSQPRQNRVLVINVKDSLNPNQVIDTDRTPVSLHYMEHLDEVWVLCWNGEKDFGSKTIVIIRDASHNVQHHAIHTQPIGNRFDLVQDIFLPPATELHHGSKFGYTVHNGQQGLFKVDLQQKKYIKAVDFSLFACVPKKLAFLPIGGKVLVKCLQKSAKGESNLILTLDYITDQILDNRTMTGTPYVSPDSRNVVIVDEFSGLVTVYTVSEKGEISRLFDVTTGSRLSDATFLRASTYQGYNVYVNSAEGPVIFSISLLNGRLDDIRDVGDAASRGNLPWNKLRPLVSGNAFSDFLATTADSSVTVVNGKKHHITCDFSDLDDPSVLVFTRQNYN